MRRIQKLMKNWTFTDAKGNKQQLDLPHTWNALDGQDGGNDYFRGTCVYEMEVEKPDYREDERVYLQFHGVNSSATVILNGEKVCTHEGGYSTFRVDITDKLQEVNQLAVKVDNSVNDRIYPQKADFTFYGGIYRDVEFLIVAREHFDLNYYGGSGIMYTTETDGKTAKVRVTTYINHEALAAGAKTKISLMDAEGKEVACGEGNKVVLELANAHLWNGLENPYLYEIKAELYKDGRVVDTNRCSCGIRSFHFSSKDGFYLNGKPYPLHGVSRHQDFKGIGNALDKDLMENDMKLICEVGANTIRLAHYQHSQEFYDLCDRTGMIVWAEIPYISEHLPKGVKNTVSQMTELIVQNFNHPSIVTWGISNEITISGNKYRKDMLKNHQLLQNLCKEMDPDRPTTLACYAMCHPFHPVAHITDLVGWNLYLGWYVPGLFLNDLWISFYHLIYPKRCLCYSEYGAEGMTNLHSAKPGRGDNSEEYQCKYHEYMLGCFKRHPYLWATYVWNMFDFAADARNQGGEPGMNHKGLVTFDRKIKKDSFYLYKAYWTKEPFVYIAGKRYAYRSEKYTEVTVYSNQKEVTLYHNGISVATCKGGHVFKFIVPMSETNQLEARSGKCTDCAVIHKAERAKKEYKLKKGDSSNWM